MAAPVRHPVTLALGRRVRERRLALGMSQEQLGLVADLDRTYIGGVERGERNLAVINLVRLAAALEVDPGEIVTGLRP